MLIRIKADGVPGQMPPRRPLVPPQASPQVASASSTPRTTTSRYSRASLGFPDAPWGEGRQGQCAGSCCWMVGLDLKSGSSALRLSVRPLAWRASYCALQPREGRAGAARRANVGGSAHFVAICARVRLDRTDEAIRWANVESMFNSTAPQHDAVAQAKFVREPL
jgi:hypothetical protein